MLRVERRTGVKRVRPEKDFVLRLDLGAGERLLNVNAQKMRGALLKTFREERELEKRVTEDWFWKWMDAFTRRKVEHAAANGRKANVYKLTEKGRQELSKLVGVGTETRTLARAGGSISPSGIGAHSGEGEPLTNQQGAGAGIPKPQGPGGVSTAPLSNASTGSPEPLQFDVEEPSSTYERLKDVA